MLTFQLRKRNFSSARNWSKALFLLTFSTPLPPALIKGLVAPQRAATHTNQKDWPFRNEGKKTETNQGVARVLHGACCSLMRRKLHEVLEDELHYHSHFTWKWKSVRDIKLQLIPHMQKKKTKTFWLNNSFWTYMHRPYMTSKVGKCGCDRIHPQNPLNCGHTPEAPISN